MKNSLLASGPAQTCFLHSVMIMIDNSATRKVFLEQIKNYTKLHIAFFHSLNSEFIPTTIRHKAMPSLQKCAIQRREQ